MSVETAARFRLSHFRPRVWPTLIVAPMLAVLIGLGLWQVERGEWKADLLARIERQNAAPPAVLPARIDDPAAWEFRRVRVEGRFLTGREMPLAGRIHGGQPGYHIVTPLLRTDRPDAPAVLVNRGFVPVDRLDPATRPHSLPAGPVMVEGIARLPSERNWAQPDNDPARNIWYWPDIPAMAALADLDPVAPLILQAAPGPDSPTLPIPLEPRIDLPNNHFQYAFTWFALAVGLVAVYVISQTRPRP